MIENNPGSRMRYLSLALFSQRMVDCLIGFLTEDKDDLSCAAEALQSLRALSGQQVSAGAVRFFTSYEQVRTLEEAVNSPDDVKGMIKMLEDLQNKYGKKSQKRREAEVAIKFFSKLEKTALLNYERPVEPLPRGIRELCQTR
jgi:hypothetical protein